MHCPVQNENNQIKITVFPLTNATGNITDEDSGDEDRLGTINNLPESMLLASTELDHKKSTTTEDDDEPAKKKPKKKAEKSKRNCVNSG